MRTARGIVSVFGVLMLCAPAAGLRAAEPEVPSADQIMDRLSEEHPRLMVEPGGFEALKRRIGEHELLQSWHDSLRKKADRIVEQPPSEYEIPDGKRLLATSRRVLKRVRLLALIYRLNGDQKYLDRAWTELKAAADFKDWNPSHFLDTAEMTHAFALGYDWLYEAWSPKQRRMLREAIVRHGLKPGLKSYRDEAGYGWWVQSGHNWNQVCNGGLAAGALAIGDERPEIAREILHSGLKSLRRAMRTYAPDGGWDEGPSYWHYATRYNVLHLASLRTALGTDFGYSGFEGFDRAGDFPIHMTGPTGDSFNFADASPSAIRAPEMFWLARRFDKPHYSRYQRRLAEPEALDLLWYRPTRDTADRLPRDGYYRGPQAATLRSAWDEPAATFVGFKAGSPRVNHGHADLGSFILEAGGVRWAVDLGSDDYNMPGYFDRSGKRWRYYRLRAEGHNTVVLTPGEGIDQKLKADAEIAVFEPGEDRAIAIADLTPAYADHAQSVRRGVMLFNNRRDVLVQDEVRADEPAEFWWFMHTRAELKLGDDRRTAVLRRKGKTLHATIHRPAGATFGVRPAQPLPSSPAPEMQASNKSVRKLTIHLPETTDLRLAVSFSTNPDAEAPENQPLKQW